MDGVDEGVPELIWSSCQTKKAGNHWSTVLFDFLFSLYMFPTRASFGCALCAWTMGWYLGALLWTTAYTSLAIGISKSNYSNHKIKKLITVIQHFPGVPRQQEFKSQEYILMKGWPCGQRSMLWNVFNASIVFSTRRTLDLPVQHPTTCPTRMSEWSDPSTKTLTAWTSCRSTVA